MVMITGRVTIGRFLPFLTTRISIFQSPQKSPPTRFPIRFSPRSLRFRVFFFPRHITRVLPNNRVRFGAEHCSKQRLGFPGRSCFFRRPRRGGVAARAGDFLRGATRPVQLRSINGHHEGRRGVSVTDGRPRVTAVANRKRGTDGGTKPSYYYYNNECPDIRYTAPPVTEDVRRTPPRGVLMTR